MELTSPAWSPLPSPKDSSLPSYFTLNAPAKRNFSEFLAIPWKHHFSLLPCSFCTGDCSHNTLFFRFHLRCFLQKSFVVHKVGVWHLFYSTLDLTHTVLITLYCHYPLLLLIPPSRAHTSNRAGTKPALFVVRCCFPDHLCLVEERKVGRRKNEKEERGREGR